MTQGKVMSDVDRREGHAVEPRSKPKIRTEILLIAMNCALLATTIVAAVRIALAGAR